MTSSVDKYRSLCESEPRVPLFARAFWLDAVCGEAQWEAAVVERDGKVVAALPYLLKRRLGFTMIDMPPLTQFIGPWVDYPDGQERDRRLSYEKELFDELLGQLPAVDSFVQRYHYNLDNWLPFYWRGYSETTRYTYVLPDLRDLDAVYERFRSSIKRQIKKAEKTVKIVDGDPERFFRLNQKTFARQDESVPYDFALVERIDRACAARGCRKIFLAEGDGGIHAALYLVWDPQSAYYLMGGGDAELRSSGAGCLIMWEAIRFAATVSRRFDFEGSMIEPIERFFRSFGAEPHRFFQIEKTTSRLLQAHRFTRRLIGAR
jgi:hypothetical protein